MLAILVGEERIDTTGIIFEVFLGFCILLLGTIFLISLYKKEIEDGKILIRQEPKYIPTQTTVYCQNCGEKAVPNTRFCVKCGDNLSY